ncbi:Wzz/FepE/Etk N-terminal domain-containing protein [Chitinophagaceae bacterium LWZ2-11]
MSENTDEISLKDLILKIRAWWKYLLSKWVIILIVGVIGGGLGLLYALFKKPTYTGTLTFVLSNDSKSGGGLMSLAGQFGLDVGGGSNGAFEGENIIELLKSRRIIKGALFKEDTIINNTLINIIGENEEFFKVWRKKEGLKNLVPFPIEGNKITPIQDSLITVIYDFVLKKYLIISKPDKKLSFYQISTISPLENIAINLTKNVVDEAAKMYIDTKTKTARENLQMLQRETDSIRGRLSGTIYESATKIDQTFNLNQALQTQRAPIQQNQVQLQALGIAYGEVMKNLEIAKITLQKETPLYQIIDEPTKKLSQKRVKKSMAMLLGLGIFVFLYLAYLMVSIVYRQIMKN